MMTDKNPKLPDPQKGPVPPVVEPTKPSNAGGTKANQQQGKNWGTKK